MEADVRDPDGSDDELCAGVRRGHGDALVQRRDGGDGTGAVRSLYPGSAGVRPGSRRRAEKRGRGA